MTSSQPNTPPPPATCASDPPPHPPRRFRRLRRTVAIACWIYLAILLAFWASVRLAGDYWWVATMLMYGPRWVFALPLIILLPAVLLLRRRSILSLLVSILVLLGPVMSLCLPWRKLALKDQPALSLRILTCNIHGTVLRFAAMADLITRSRPDVIAFQEWTGRFQPALFPDSSWHTQRDGELLLASRFPLKKLKTLVGPSADNGDATCYEIQTPAGRIYLINIHLMSPHRALNAILDNTPNAISMLNSNSNTRLAEAAIVSRFAATLPGPVLLAGDFNMPSDSAGYHQRWSAFTDAFTSAGFGFGYSYYTRFVRTRIDHILGGPGWQCPHAAIGPNVGSPHRPLIADMQLVR